MKTLQRLTLPWLHGIFGSQAYDPLYRAARLVEEALEFAQAVGLHPSSAHELVDYVWDRPAGEPQQELGGVLLTTMALAERLGYDCEEAARTEMARCLAFTEEQRERMRTKDRPRARAA